MIDIFDVTLPALTGAETRRAYVYLPEAAGDGDRRFPVLYMFDGHNVFFDEDATYGKSWGLGEYLDAFEVPLIVAAVECNHGEDNARLKEYAPYSFSALGFGSIEGRGPRTMDWLVHVFKPGIDRDYPTLPDREHTFIAGSSMGGLMSLYAVSCFNETFSRAAALSPSLNFGPRSLERLLLGAKMRRDTVIYMDMGETELKWRGTRRLFRHFCELLQKEGVLLTSRLVPGGEHNEASWEKQIPFFLPALLYGLED
ncbi:MAG: alpha/beta hydrolase [Oscillospiraceae bacterium]|nr:alpha/beta hydrolase [Oscillospiraceae bacterium]